MKQRQKERVADWTWIIAVMVCLACSFCGATDNSMDGFIARSIKGIYSVTSSVDVIVTGQANTDLLVWEATGSDMVTTVNYHRYAKQSSAELIAEGAIS